MNDKFVVVRIIYTDLTSEYLKIDLKTMIAAIDGLADKKSLHLGGKEIAEIHLVSHFNHGNYTKIEGSTSDGFSLTILKKESNNE